MKLTISGPQALTMFPVAKAELIPHSAKSSSFATPQAYYCVKEGMLKLFLKGQEYCFYEEPPAAPTLEACDAVNAEAHKTLEAEYAVLTERVDVLEEKMCSVYDKMYMPMRQAFETAHEAAKG